MWHVQSGLVSGSLLLTESVSLCPREALGSVEPFEKTPRKLRMASDMLEAIQLPVMDGCTDVYEMRDVA